MIICLYLPTLLLLGVTKKNFPFGLSRHFQAEKMHEKKVEKNQLHKQYPPCGPKIYWDISPQTLFFLRSKQFSEAELKEN